jgi:hypothetical protein
MAMRSQTAGTTKQTTATDEQLKQRWSASKRDGWSDERETIFTELTFRGVNMLGL